MPDETGASPSAQQSRARRIFSGQAILALACGLLVVASVTLWIDNRNLRAEAQPQPHVSPLEPETPGSVFAFMVPPAGLGAGNRPRRLTLPTYVSILQIGLGLDQLWPGGIYNVTISSGGQILWSQSASLPPGATKVTLLAPAGIFSGGQYEITLASPQGAEGPDALKRYYLAVNQNTR